MFTFLNQKFNTFSQAAQIMVKLEVQQDLGNKAPTFDRMIHLLEICQQQEELSNGKSKSAASSLQQHPSIVMEVSTNQPADLTPFDQQAFLAGVPKSQWGEAVQFYAVTANHCFACGKESHYMRDCPTRARGIPLNQQQCGPFPYPPQPYGFQSPPFQQHQSGSGMLPLQQHLRPADNFCPNYSQHQSRSQASTTSNVSRLTGEASVRQAEVDGLIDGLSSVDFQSMEASFGEVSVSAIIDSGATHNLTGNLSCLHNFCQLKHPIPLNVATRGPGAYTSGIGELRLRVPSGRTVTLNHVFYWILSRYSTPTKLIGSAVYLSEHKIAAFSSQISFCFFSVFLSFLSCFSYSDMQFILSSTL
ncbi:hypothetical protein PCASD_08926 [Puccinia coronata f. sp. avenae]|uniref:CCHC-type domain-containing protein n=1 Tax=Puccinia coronata f. sp. avenae TaxID=200324 RepID=A0A2N5UN93_9BASI|nr:hypothetical protein PCASD_08926 [Puccinia coronata f. sp. avenae]